MTAKNYMLKNMKKQELRDVVSKAITIDDKKLSKMNRGKCLEIVKELSYNQIIELRK